VTAAAHPRHRRHGVELRWRLFKRQITHSELRNSDFFLLVLAALAGSGAGLGVVLLRHGIDDFHHLTFGVAFGEHLTDGTQFQWWRVLVLLTGGGLVVGLVGAAIRRWRRADTVDPIEANALYGGRMSLTDSINLAVMTLLSGGFGASVGLEAAYTQLGSGVASKVGHVLRLRRDDLRTLVGCGAAAAIAGAYNAPLAGAFYAFELILGSYTLATLAPVVIAALAGTFTARMIFGPEPIFIITTAIRIHSADYWAFVLVGLGSAGLGIFTMLGVTRAEAWFRTRIPWRVLRPMVGGLAVGCMALVWPEVLGSGHGAILSDLRTGFALPTLAAIILAKMLASAISVGSGFRGGLFSTSLFLGSLFGSAAALILARIVPGLALDPLPYALVGMGSVAAAIIGAPITMILLVLETTGDFPSTVGVTIGVLAASIVVRRWFGYSFATWRFHLRGLKISGAEDVGWIEALKVGRLMREDAQMVPAEMPVEELRQRYPIGSTKQVFVTEGVAFAGVIDLADLHSPDLPKEALGQTAGAIAQHPPDVLVPEDGVQTALHLFSAAHVEVLPVVADRHSMKVAGYLTEAFALRRYNQELERRRGDSLGASGLYSPAIRPRS
jgi:CIC family chloride channel protein